MKYNSSEGGSAGFHERRTKTPEQALESLTALCARAERSSGDARRLMSRWGVDPGRRDEVLEKLIKLRFIDDARYAAAFVREKSNLSGWGVHKIRAALAAKGIARGTIEEAIAQINPETAGEKLAVLLARKARTTKAATPRELRAKLVRYALGRGFEYSEVLEAVDNISKDEE